VSGAARRGQGRPSRAREIGAALRGLTVVPSPVAETLKVPAALLGAYEYACQPTGGFGIDDMNGPAVWFRPLVATKWARRVSGNSRGKAV
jgi:hypothetical protein